MLDMSNIQKSVCPLYNGTSTNVTSVTTFDQLREQYSAACPEHSYKTRIFSMDPLIIYLEDYITAPEREYILNQAEPGYTPSQVSDDADDYQVKGFVSSIRTSLTAYFYNDPIINCIKERSASFQGNVPVNRIEDLQAVKYTVGDEFRLHWDWWADAENPRISTIFAYLGCDSGESSSGGECEGGATQFPESRDPFPLGWCDVIDCNDESELGGVAFKPVVGNAIFWSNVYPNGTYHERTSHAGMPVKKGRKVGLNIWTHLDEFILPPYVPP